MSSAVNQFEVCDQIHKHIEGRLGEHHARIGKIEETLFKTLGEFVTIKKLLWVIVTLLIGIFVKDIFVG